MEYERKFVIFLSKFFFFTPTSKCSISGAWVVIYIARLSCV